MISKIIKRQDRLFISVLVIIVYTTNHSYAYGNRTPLIGKRGNGAIYGASGENVINIGDFNDILFINGSGVAGGVQITLFWDKIIEWDSSLGVGKIQTIEAFANGSFQTTFNIPSTSNGTHYIWIQDVNSNRFTRSNPFYVYPRTILEYTQIQPEETLHIQGYGFGSEKKIVATVYNSTHNYIMESSTITGFGGQFESFFRIPKWSYGSYKINTSDLNGNFHLHDLTIGPTIRFQRKGSVGTILKVIGKGFVPGSTIPSNQILFNKIPSQIFPDPVIVTEQGSLNVKILIPNKEKEWYTIIIKDGVNTASLKYNILSSPSLTISSDYGVPGQIITINSQGLTQLENKAKIFVDNIELSEKKVISGAFESNITLPALKLGEKYNITVVDEYGINATAKIYIDYFDIFTDKTDYKSGSILELDIYGFNSTNGGPGKIYLDGQESQEFFGGDRFFSKTIYIPTLEPGPHTIMVEDLNNNIRLEKHINITETSKLTIHPTKGPPNRNITASAHNLIHKNNTEVTWRLYNKTYSKDISDIILTGNPGLSSKTTQNGTVDSWFTIPETLSQGNYNLTCTTEYENTVQSATTQITVSKEYTSISTVKQEYRPGNQITFNIRSNMVNNNSKLTVYYPDGYIHGILELDPEKWVQTRGNFTVRSPSQTTSNGRYLTIPQDSEGTWSWVLTNGISDNMNGSFLVVPEFTLPTFIEIEKGIEKLNVDLMKTEVNKIHNITRTVKETTTILMRQIDDITNNIDKIINNIENTNNKIQTTSDLIKSIEIQKIETLLNYQIAIYASITAAYLIVFNKIYKWIVIELIIEE